MQQGKPYRVGAEPARLAVGAREQHEQLALVVPLKAHERALGQLQGGLLRGGSTVTLRGGGA